MIKRIIVPMRGTEENTISNVLTILALLIFFGGAFAGIILGRQRINVEDYYTRIEIVFVWQTAITIWLTSLLSGVLLIAFSEIIKLLKLGSVKDYAQKGMQAL